MRGGEGRGGEDGSWWKEGEGTSQRTYKNDTWTTVWGWIVGAGGGLGGRGKNWDTLIEQQLKNKI